MTSTRPPGVRSDDADDHPWRRRRDPCMMTCGSSQILCFRRKVRAPRCRAVLGRRLMRRWEGRSGGYREPSLGVWRSLVAHLVRDEGVASSNLATPTNSGTAIFAAVQTGAGPGIGSDTPRRAPRKGRARRRDGTSGRGAAGSAHALGAWGREFEPRRPDHKMLKRQRSMAQSGSASVWGTGGRRFEPCYSDQVWGLIVLPDRSVPRSSGLKAAGK